MAIFSCYVDFLMKLNPDESRVPQSLGHLPRWQKVLLDLTL